MKHTYKLTGMTCGSCEQKVREAILPLENIISVNPSKEKESIEVEMNEHVPLNKLKEAISLYGNKYKVLADSNSEISMQAKSWFSTYKPILLIFSYIMLVTLIVEFLNGLFVMQRLMAHFMAGFFLVFSFFKLLNLKGFAQSYVMYDIVAMKYPSWAYVYAFIELLLGVGYLSEFNPLLVNSAALIVMSVSIVGVLKTVLDNKKIKCACLGDVFNLPMSTVTIIEDGLMILMSAVMLFNLV